MNRSCAYKRCTHEFLGLTTVLNLDGRLVVLRDNLEGEVLHVSLHFSIGELAADETLRIEDGILGVHRSLVLRGIADQPLAVGERDIRGCRAVTLVVGNDFDTVVLPDTDAAKSDELRDCQKRECAAGTHE